MVVVGVFMCVLRGMANGDVVTVVVNIPVLPEEPSQLAQILACTPVGMYMFACEADRI